MSSQTNRFAKIAKESRETTNEQLSKELSSVTRLTAAEIEDLLPDRGDKQRLARLMEIVSADTEQNAKVATVRENFKELGSVAVKVLGAVL